MTKEQSIAQALLTVLGIQFVVELGGQLTMMIQGALWIRLVCMGVILGVMGVCWRELVLNSGRWARRIAPDDSQERHFASNGWQVSTLRLTMVFCGLMLMGGQLETLVRGGLFLVHPEGLRQAVQTMIISGMGAWWASVKYPLVTVVDGIKLALAIYLLLGAPHWVRAQTRNNHRFTERASL